MLIDQAKITVQAGHGGDGLVHFLSTRRRPKGGPDGGDGGNGGSVYFKAESDITLLNQFRHKKEFQAQSGNPGKPKKSSGKAGQDLILNLPIGSVVNLDDGTSFELTQPGQTVLVAKGGRGGKGNYRFATSVNRAPQTAQPGQKVESKLINIELKLIANIGLVGLPNAGKSSLLNELTSAKVKTGSYAFTTLEPNLGVARGGLIIADIPGLIEGASSGKGLGDRFLRHVERTSLLVHCISSESTQLKKDYQIIRQELKNFNKKLLKKPELIILTKSDLIDDPKKLKKLIKTINAHLAVSIIDNDSLKKLQSLISSSYSDLRQPLS